VSTTYLVFSEAHEPHHPTAQAGAVCKICCDLGVGGRVGSVMPSEPTPIDVPPPPVEPPDTPVNPSPEPELRAPRSEWRDPDDLVATSAVADAECIGVMER